MNAVPSSTTSLRSGAFWAEIKPAEHLVQCYGHDDGLLDTLEGFVSSGLRAGEGVIVVASAPHLHELEKRLRAHWLDVDRARWEERYHPLLAQEMFTKFMADDGMPDDERFRAVVLELLERARGPGRKVRIFGEMVNVLWAEGNLAATVQLENLWTQLLRGQQVPLFCAYSRKLFDGQPASAFRGICNLHTMVLPG